MMVRHVQSVQVLEFFNVVQETTFRVVPPKIGQKLSKVRRVCVCVCTGTALHCTALHCIGLRFRYVYIRFPILSHNLQTSPPPTPPQQQQQTTKPSVDIEACNGVVHLVSNVMLPRL
jgi:hypothetical protein